MPDSYYELPTPDLFECARCHQELDERDRGKETSYCQPCYRWLDFLNELNTARNSRRASRAAGVAHGQQIQNRPAEGANAMPTPISAETLDLLLGELDPFVAGEVIDALARLGLLPEPPDPDAPIAYTVRDQPPTVAAAAVDYARRLALV